MPGSPSSPWTPSFTRFFTAQSLSWLGSSMTPVALAFGVLDAAGDPGALGAVLAALSIPMLVFLLVGGVVADRFPRSRLLVATHAASAVTQLATAVWFFWGDAPMSALLVVSALSGAASAMTGPALRGVVTELVPEQALQRAASARATSRNAFRLLGPSVAGVLVAVSGAGWALLIDALCLAIAAALLATVRTARPIEAAGSVLEDLREGWREFASRRWLWTISVAFFVVNLALAAVWLVAGPVIAAGTIGAAGWGIVLGVRAGGLILGGLLAYRWTPGRPLVWGQLAVIPLALSFLALGLAPRLPVLIAVALLAGIGAAIEGILWESTLQREIPARAQSRVASYDMLSSFASVPLGQLLAPVLILAWGPGPLAIVGGAVVLVAGLTPLLSTQVRGVRSADRRPD